MSKEITIQTLDEDKKELLRKTICQGANDLELELFLHQCNEMKLNPFLKQIYLIKVGGKMTIVTSIDGYRLLAERTGKYMPGREATFTYDKSGRLYSATSYVKKFGPDKQWHEVAATAVFSEFAKGNLWDKMPCVMLSKVAESMAIRRAFPADLSGVYTREEMDQAHVEEMEQLGQMDVKPALQVENKPSESVELITKEEVHYIESMIRDYVAPKDDKYRQGLLDLFSERYKESLASFEGIRKKDLQQILRSIDRKIAPSKQ